MQVTGIIFPVRTFLFNLPGQTASWSSHWSYQTILWQSGKLHLCAQNTTMANTKRSGRAVIENQIYGRLFLQGTLLIYITFRDIFIKAVLDSRDGTGLLKCKIIF